jgi:hypothetical protein
MGVAMRILLCKVVVVATFADQEEPVFKLVINYGR